MAKDESKPKKSGRMAVKDLNKSVKVGTRLYEELAPDHPIYGQLDTSTTPAMQGLLDRLNQLFLSSQQTSPLEQEALQAARVGMQGYQAPEIQAMREAGGQQINTNLQGQLRAQQIQGGGSVRGAAAMAQGELARRSAMQAQGNLERDLIIQNAQEIQARRQAFTNLVTQTEGARFQRSAQTGSLYGGALAGEEASRTNKQIYNLGADANNELTRMGTIMDIGGAYLGQKQSNRATNLTNANLEFQKQMQQQVLEQLKAQQAQFASFGGAGASTGATA